MATINTSFFPSSFLELLIDNEHNRKYLITLKKTIESFRESADTQNAITIKNNYFRHYRPPNCKLTPLNPATKNKCIGGLIAGFAFLSTALLLTTNPALSIAVAVVGISLLLTSTALLLDGGPAPKIREAEEGLFTRN